MKKLLPLILFCSLFLKLSAQYFETGQDPASIKWRQINSSNFQLIYPDYFEKQAQILIEKLERIYPYGSYSLNFKPKKMPIVLHTQSVISNGLVAWAPRRSEFYTNPSQSIYGQDWLEQLAIHEFRHIVQLNKVHYSLPRWYRYLLGEQGSALVMGISLPWWFIEGDAVITETALATAGRGRHPSFLTEQRAQVIEKGVFTYDKAYMGSYREFVPNHYSLGYYLTGSLRAKHGNTLFEDAVGNLFKHNLKQTLKRQTGLNIVKNYRAVFDSLNVAWQKDDAEYVSAPFQLLSKKERFYSSYTLSHWIDDNEILTLKKSFDRIPSFVKIMPDGSEVQITSPGTLFDESVDGVSEWVVWSEQLPNLRWQHAGKSRIVVLNIENGVKITVNPEFTASTPAISPDKSKIVVVETDYSYNHFLSAYRLPDGKLLNRFQSERNSMFFSPRWLTDDKVAVIELADNGKKITSVDFLTNKTTDFTTAGFADIKHLRYSHGKLYFISSYTGKNCLYRLNIESGNIEQIYEPRFGAESPAVSPDGKSIVLSDYTSDGFRLIKIDAGSDFAVPFSQLTKGEFLLAEKLAAQEPGVPDLSVSDSTKYTSEKYSKTKNLLNFHSWAPVNIDSENYLIEPGISLSSQDKLGISVMELGYRWDHTEKTGRFTANYSFKGWYPVFNLRLSHGPRAADFVQIKEYVNDDNEVVKQDTISSRFTWGHTSGSLNVRMPLNLERDAYRRVFQPEMRYSYTLYKAHESTPEVFQTGSYQSLSYRLYYHSLKKQSYLAMYPGLGLILDGTYRHSFAGTLGTGNIKALQSVIYLPGLIRTHGIRLYAGYQKKESQGVAGFTDVVRFARGWGSINTNEINSAGADYKLPLFYPDFNMAGLIYLKRVKASLFGDFTRLSGNLYNNGNISGSFTNDISSIGTELTFDVNFLRFYAPAEIGFRVSYLPEIQDTYFNFLFSINLTSF